MNDKRDKYAWFILSLYLHFNKLRMLKIKIKMQKNGTKPIWDVVKQSVIKEKCMKEDEYDKKIAKKRNKNEWM